MKTKTCCFSGHGELYPEKIPLLEKELHKIISDCIEKGYRRFLCGGAKGFDFLAAKTLLEHQNTCPEIQLELVFPYHYLPDEETRTVVLEQMIREELNVRKTEELVADTLEKMRAKAAAEKQEQKEKRCVTDFRLFTNTIKQSVEVIRRAGVDVVYEDEEQEDGCQITIRIRKKE